MKAEKKNQAVLRRVLPSGPWDGASKGHKGHPPAGTVPPPAPFSMQNNHQVQGRQSSSQPPAITGHLWDIWDISPIKTIGATTIITIMTIITTAIMIMNRALQACPVSLEHAEKMMFRWAGRRPKPERERNLSAEALAKVEILENIGV